MAEILFNDESYKIVGALFEVYKEMSCGFLEAVYQEYVELELADQKIPFRSQVQLNLFTSQTLSVLIKIVLERFGAFWSLRQ